MQTKSAARNIFYACQRIYFVDLCHQSIRTSINRQRLKSPQENPQENPLIKIKADKEGYA